MTTTRAPRGSSLRLPSTAALVVALGAFTVPAEAAQWSSKDAQGDATTGSFDPDPPPCGTFTRTPTETGDVRRLTVRHTRSSVVVRLRVTGLEDASDVGAELEIRSPKRSRWVSLSSTERGNVRVDFGTAPDYDEVEVDECGGSSVLSTVSRCRGATGEIDTTAETFEARVPRRCLGRPRTVKVAASVYAVTPTGDFAFDRWAPEGYESDGPEPPYGDRVGHPTKKG